MKTVLRLLRFLKPASGQVLLSILAGLATIGAGVGMLGTSAYLIAGAALHPSIAELQVAIVGVRFFGISRGVFRYCERLISHSVNLKLLSEIRVWFYRQVEPLAPAGLQDYSSGDLLQRSISDIETLENFYVRVISPVVVALAAGVCVSWFVGVTYPLLSWILAAGLLVNGLFLPVLAYLFNRSNMRKMVQTRSAYSAEIVEYLQGLGDLQLFDAEEKYRLQLMKKADQFSDLQVKAASMNGLNSGLTLMFTNLTLLGCLWVFIPQVSGGNVRGVMLAVIAMVVLASFEMVNPLPAAAQQLGASIEAARRLFEIADRQPDQIPQPRGMIPENPAREMQIEHLHFRFPGREQDAITDLSLILEPGKKVGITGHSGGGKTSLVNLIMRYWDFTQGTMKFDTGNLKDLHPDYIRAQFGVMSQNPYLFNLSLRENLALAAPDASDEEMSKVLEKVLLAPWLATLPSGLDSNLRENGVQMSGGEKQRVALAQLLLRQSTFLLLDEPTANLDSLTGKKLLDLILELSGDKSVLLITHDGCSLQTMDEILLLENGNVIERGKFDDLISQGGKFAEQIKLQKNGIG